jgi:hypothetical protein
MRDRLTEQRTNVIVVQCVDHLPSVPVSDDETEMAENPQLLRDRRLLHPDIVGEIAN